MTADEIKEYYSKDERSLEELVSSLIERKIISLSIARKYFGYTTAFKINSLIE